MTAEDLVTKLIGPIVSALTFIAGAVWVYWIYLRRRENEPATDIDLELAFVGIQDHQWIIEVTAILENKSLVRHAYRDFQLAIRYLLPEDKVADGPAKIGYQLNCPHTIDKRITPGSRNFENAAYINPKQRFLHRYITSVPERATFVWVQCKFIFTIKKDATLKCISQRIFRVPREESQSSP